jgi:hypothetical protein
MRQLALHVDKNYAGNPIRALVPWLGHDDPANTLHLAPQSGHPVNVHPAAPLRHLAAHAVAPASG